MFFIASGKTMTGRESWNSGHCFSIFKGCNQSNLSLKENNTLQMYKNILLSESFLHQ